MKNKKYESITKALLWKCICKTSYILFWNSGRLHISWHTILTYKNKITFWHRSITFNSNKSPTWCNNFSVYYPDVCLQLNMFRLFSRPSSGAQWLQCQPLVLPSYRGDSRAVFVVGPAGDTKVKPEANTGVIGLLMMGGKTPETCRAVNKRQDNKMENCSIWLVIYLNKTCVLISSTTFIWNILHSEKNSQRYYNKCT